MALELKQSPIMAQQLIMTPQLQQAIKLLQLSRIELVEAINEELEENPLLEEQSKDESEEDSKTDDERDVSEQDIPEIPEVTIEEHARDDVDWESYLSEYNTEWAAPSYEERDLPSIGSITAAKTNLYSHLMWQLNMKSFDEEQKEVSVHIIGNLDEDGYLDIPLEEISQITGSPLEKVSETLRKIQNLDPVGVAARDMQESLLIQARFQGLEGTICEKIIMNHLKDLEGKRLDRLAKSLSITIQEVLTAVSIIQGMEPKPGRGFSDDETIYITPDIYVFKVGNDYEIVQNEDGLPKLRVNGYYKDVLRSRDSLSENAKIYIQEKLRSAAWLIKSIYQRQKTIYRVTESIVRFQKDFLDNGITYLKPLVLRDIAEDIEMHESTISRVTTNKYVHTPQGLFELKFFFNSSINRVDGDAVASGSVKEQIKKNIKSENKAKPYSDQEIADLLEKQNINIARRTVAKYRESMAILPSRKRKYFY
ncbi:MAG: RNA polymerase factor sigma-54 [Desulfobacteraceae bacterium]|nr:RNA polymerase factor sigma-54 [Desulfobacteraceae bacterium]